MGKTKSFTLIEILVATTIFVAMVVVGMATLTSVFNNRSKLTSLKNVQEAGRLGMEMMANEVKRANNVAQADPYSYDGIGITDERGILDKDIENGLYEGNSLKTSYLNSDGKVIEKFFQLSSVSSDSGTCDPLEGNCRLEMRERVYTPGAFEPPAYSGPLPINSPDVDITSLNFKGYHLFTFPLPSINNSYVTIEMTVQSRWQEKVAEKETATLTTTVRPDSYSGTAAGPPGVAYLFVKEGEVLVNKGRFIASSIYFYGEDGNTASDCRDSYHLLYAIDPPDFQPSASDPGPSPFVSYHGGSSISDTQTNVRNRYNNGKFDIRICSNSSCDAGSFLGHPYVFEKSTGNNLGRFIEAGVGECTQACYAGHYSLTTDAVNVFGEKITALENDGFTKAIEGYSNLFPNYEIRVLDDVLDDEENDLGPFKIFWTDEDDVFRKRKGNYKITAGGHGATREDEPVTHAYFATEGEEIGQCSKNAKGMCTEPWYGNPGPFSCLNKHFLYDIIGNFGKCTDGLMIKYPDLYVGLPSGQWRFE